MNQNNAHFVHPVVFAIRSLFSKLRQNPEIYPIKYYKKNRTRKSRQYEFVK